MIDNRLDNHTLTDVLYAKFLIASDTFCVAFRTLLRTVRVKGDATNRKCQALLIGNVYIG